MVREILAAPVQLYVYYKLGAARDRALAAVAGMLAAVEASTGVAGRLLMRCDDEETWMEVYRDVRDATAFRAVLDDLVRQHGVASVARDGMRHVECFVPVATPQDV